MQGIESKIVMITGASSGIGESTARHLASLGARVVLGARRQDRLDAIVTQLRSQGHDADAKAMDVTDPESMHNFVEHAIKRHGRIDVMINSAGIMPLSRLEHLRVDEWNRTIDVNIRGVLNGIAATLPIFKRQAGGHIINVSSIAAHRVFPTAAVYCASKFAVAAISEGLRQESRDIRVTVISPGVTESELGNTTKDPEAAEWLAAFRGTIIPASAIARAIGFAISQPDDVDVNEIIVRPVSQES